MESEGRVPKYIDPTEVNRSLHQVALYLTAWETLKSGVVERVKGFFSRDWHASEKGEIIHKPSEEYRREVVSLHPKDEFHACCLWLKSLGAFDDADLAGIELARSHRNEVAHRVVDYIIHEDCSVSRDALLTIYDTVKKLDRWWLAHVELGITGETNSELFEAALRGDFLGGSGLLLDLILPVFDGDFERLNRLHDKLSRPEGPDE